MSERISVRGKGAELFFGQDADPTAGNSESANVDATQSANTPSSKPAATPPSHPATIAAAMPPSHPATMPPSAQSSSQAFLDSDSETIRRLRDLLGEEHSLHYSYRFTRSEIDAIRDAVYELEVKHEVPVTRNDVVRLGLNWLIDDYRAHAGNSVLVRVLKGEKWKPGR